MTEQKRRIPKGDRIIYYSVIAFMGLILVISSCILLQVGKAGDMHRYIKLLSTLFIMLFAALLYFFCYLGIWELTRRDKIFSTAVFVIFLELFFCGFIILFSGSGHPKLLLVVGTLCCYLAILIHLLLWFYQRELLRRPVARHVTAILLFLCILYVIYITVNIFYGQYFFVNERGYLAYPDSYFTTGLFFLIYAIFTLYALFSDLDRRRKLSLLSISAFPLLLFLLSAVWWLFEVSIIFEPTLYCCMLLAAYIVFFNIYLDDKRTLLYQKIALAEQEKKQTELQTAVALSQIQPHFLYNSLACISGLCAREQAEQSRDAVNHFADYLRGNLDSLKNPRRIPFEKELEHTETYLWLEKMRFGDRLTVLYDIQYRTFILPALTLQPLVENAVRYGVCRKEEGGTVCIMTYQTEDDIVILVSDDGPGFDPQKTAHDGRTHIGIANVRSRLASLSGGTLEIESRPGFGTTVTIRLPLLF